MPIELHVPTSAEGKNPAKGRHDEPGLLDADYLFPVLLPVVVLVALLYLVFVVCSSFSTCLRWGSGGEQQAGPRVKAARVPVSREGLVS